MRRAILFGIFLLLCLPAQAQRINLPPITRVTLDNGAQIVLMESHRAPMLTVLAEFPGGKAADPAGKAGVAALTTFLLRRGTRTRTAEQIAEQIDFLGGSLNTGVDADRITLTLNLLARDAATGLDLLADILRNPTFPEEELNRERQLMLAGLEALRDDPGGVADRVAEATAFAGHLYGVDATLTSLKAITADDIRSYYSHCMTPNHLILVAVGDFKPSDMLARLRSRFAGWLRGSERVANVPPVPATPRRVILIDKPDATQTQVRWVRTAYPRASSDYFAGQLAETILGGSFTSRLVEAIRINRSLTYDIDSRFIPLLRGGRFEVSTYTKLTTTRALLDATTAVLRRTALQGLTAQELQKAKSYLSGLYAIEVQTPEALAGQLADIAFYRLPSDYLQTYLSRLRAVSLQQVDRIARTYFSPDALSLVLVAPAAQIKAQLAGLVRIDIQSIEMVGK